MYALFVTSNKRISNAPFHCTLLNGYGMCKMGDDSFFESVIDNEHRHQVKWRYSQYPSRRIHDDDKRDQWNIYADSLDVSYYEIIGNINTLKLGSMISPPGVSYASHHSIELKLHIHSAFDTASFQGSTWLSTVFDINHNGMAEMYKHDYLMKAKKRLFQPGDTIPFHSANSPNLAGIIHLTEKLENDHWIAALYYAYEGEQLDQNDILLSRDERSFDGHSVKFEHDLATLVSEVDHPVYDDE